MRSLVASTCLAAILALSSTALAAPTRFTMPVDSVVGGAELLKGTYRIEVSPAGDTVTFSRGKKVVATSPCSVSALAESVPEDMATFTKTADGKMQVSRLLLAASKQEIRLGATATR